jgi:hypothetical protein
MSVTRSVITAGAKIIGKVVSAKSAHARPMMAARFDPDPVGTAAIHDWVSRAAHRSSTGHRIAQSAVAMS